ncbi:hypothetical protein [Lysinibacillus xylanilyticus]|uniref:hypothetical protein n=1 Tax=Lysinibacillus xylanilyticus TaxID=582475 RepID=UPI003D06A629
MIEMNPVEATFVSKKKMTLEEVTTEETAKLYLETVELKEFLVTWTSTEISCIAL